MENFEDISSIILKWANYIQSISIKGLLFSAENDYEKERYQNLLKVSAEMQSIINKEMTLDENLAIDIYSKIIKKVAIGEIQYPTPMLSIGGAIFNKDGNILLVKKNNKNIWSLPGGYSEINNSPLENLKREIFEETGLHIKPSQFFGIFDSIFENHPFQRVYFILFKCEIIGGLINIKDREEISEIKYFSLDETECINQSSQEQVKIAFQFYKNRNKDFYLA